MTRELNLKKVSGSITRPANVTAYTAGDVVSDATGDAHFTFDAPVLGEEFSGIIRSARCNSDDAVAPPPDLELFLFHTDVVAVADNAAVAFTDAEMLTLIGIIDFPTGNFKVGKAGAGGAQACYAHNLGIHFKSLTSKIYGQLVIRNAYVPVSGEVITVELLLESN